MPNPFLRPSDPRFRKADLRDEAGKNRFAEEQQPAESAAGDDRFQATADTDPRPFRPRYDVQQEPRTRLLTSLGVAGWMAASLGAASLTGLIDSGWICPLLGVAPAAAGWLLARQDLEAIESGAIDSSASRGTRRAHWLALTALVAALAITIGMIFLQMSLLPEGL
jgi:hypothetical protein